MFYKCRLNFRQTGMIFGENAIGLANLDGMKGSLERVCARLTNYECWG